MANIVLRNGWNQPAIYKNVASVTFQTDIEGVTATYYENGSGGSGGPCAQANWVQNDTRAADYIKNRPFYSSYEEIIAPIAVELAQGTYEGLTLYGAILGELVDFSKTEYTVIWGDDLWFCDVVEIEGKKYLGDPNIVGISTESAGEVPPFVGIYEEGILTFYSNVAAALTIGLGGPEEIHTIDPKYLPEIMMSGADWEAEEGQPGFIANKPTTFGLDEVQLQNYLTNNEYITKTALEAYDYATEKFITEGLSELEKKIPSIEGLITETEVDQKIKKAKEEIQKLLEEYADISWVEENYATKTEAEKLSNRIKAIEDDYVGKTSFKTLEDAVSELQKALVDYKTEVAKTYATKNELIESQADWLVEDVSNSAAIKNKPFGIIPDIVSITEDSIPAVFEPVEGGYQASLGIELDTTKKYTLLWNAVSIDCEIGVEKNGIVLNTNGTVFVTEKPAEEIKLGLRLTDNIYRLDTKYLNKEEILEGMASQKYVQSQIGAIPQSDWNQNDLLQKSYIKNRPFYTEDDNVKPQQLEFQESARHPNRYSCQKKNDAFLYYKNGDVKKTYTVIWNEKVYENCSCREVVFRSSEAGQVNILYKIPNVVGNPELWETTKFSCVDSLGTDLPFVFSLTQNFQGCGLDIDDTYITTTDYSNSHSLRVYATDAIHKIDTKYLPDTALATPDWNAKEGSAGYIQNKPTIPEPQIQADWLETNTNSASFILNKPEIIQPQQANWKEQDSDKLSYIQNLPKAFRFNSEGYVYVTSNSGVTLESWRADWQEDKPCNKGFIRNKPFGEIPYQIYEKIPSFDDGEGSLWGIKEFVGGFPNITVGNKYVIKFNSLEYTAFAKKSVMFKNDLIVSGVNGFSFGNASLLNASQNTDFSDSGENFFVEFGFEKNDYGLIGYIIFLNRSLKELQEVDFSIKEFGDIKKIDKKYLPDECFNGGLAQEQLKKLEELIQRQNDTIRTMQEKIDELSIRVLQLEQGNTGPNPEIEVEQETLKIDGVVSGEILELSTGIINEETLILTGRKGPEIEQETLSIDGEVVEEILEGSGTVSKDGVWEVL